jgi:hypothetical protein
VLSAGPFAALLCIFFLSCVSGPEEVEMFLPEDVSATVAPTKKRTKNVVKNKNKNGKRKEAF